VLKTSGSKETKVDPPSAEWIQTLLVRINSCSIPIFRCRAPDQLTVEGRRRYLKMVYGVTGWHGFREQRKEEGYK
jgi:hypothetical protein